MSTTSGLPSFDSNVTEFEFTGRIPITDDSMRTVKTGKLEKVFQNIRDGPKGAYSEEQFVVEVVLSGFFCLLGLVFNMLALVGFRKDPQRNSTVYILSALAVADWLILVNLCLMKVIPFLCVYAEVESCYGPLLEASVYIWPVGCMSQTAMIWLVVMVSVDRYIAVCHPFKAVILSTVSNAKKAIALIWVLAILANVPRFFYYLETDHSTTIKMHQNATAAEVSTNETVTIRSSELPFGDDNDFDALGPVKSGKLNQYMPSPREALGNTVWYRIIYYISFTFIFTYLIPTLMLLCLNIRLTKAIRQANLTHAKMVSETAQHRKISHSVTINIIAVVAVFLVCQTPDFVLVILNYPDLHVDNNTLAMMSSTNTMFMAINSSVNFFIYCLFYKKFRKVVKLMLCPIGVQLDGNPTSQ